MDRKSLIKMLESELEQSRKDFEDGKFIPFEEFDWGFLGVAESQENMISTQRNKLR